MVEVYNVTRGTVLANAAAVADTWTSRVKGLLGRDGLEPGEGLIIDPCNSIHTVFMRFPIDVLFVARGGRVIRLLEHLRPYRITGIVFGARYVVELPAGTVAATSTQAGDQLIIRGAGDTV